MNGQLRRNDWLRAVGSATARWQVVDPTPRNGCIKVFDSETLKDEYTPFANLNARVVSGELILVRENAPRVSLAAQNDPKLQQKIAAALQHLRAIEQFQRKYEVSFASAYNQAKAAHEKEKGPAQDRGVTRGSDEAQTAAPPALSHAFEEFPSRATAYRYLGAQRNGLPVLRGDANKGNRTPRYGAPIVTLICDAAQKLYLQPKSRMTFTKLTEYINDRIHESGLLEAGRCITREFVKNTIHEHLSVDVEKDRMDPKDVPAGKSVAARSIVVSTPFERVEQDALHLPFVVLTEYGPVTNVYLVHSIECFLGMPLGWHLVVGAPSESDGMRCVESTLFSKAAAFKRLDYECELDVFGTPHQLVFDNGPETKGERMSRLVRLGIDSMHCKARHAHGKPFIERLNKSLKTALETLPGCTRFDGKDGRRDPVKEGDELMTLLELERWIVRWYFESWANNPLERHIRSDFHAREKLGSTPAARLRRMNELGYAMPLSPPMAEWRMTLYEHEVRTLSRKTGITCNGFSYRGDNLRYLIERYGEVAVKVFFDPEDYRQVFVDDGTGMPLVALIEQGVDATTPAHSVAYMKDLTKQADVERVEAPAAVAFRRDVQRESAKPPRGKRRGKPGRTEQNRLAATAVKADKALQRAIDRPLGMVPGVVTVAPTVAEISFDDGEAFVVLDRVTGEKQ